MAPQHLNATAVAPLPPGAPPPLPTGLGKTIAPPPPGPPPPNSGRGTDYPSISGRADQAPAYPAYPAIPQPPQYGADPAPAYDGGGGNIRGAAEIGSYVPPVPPVPGLGGPVVQPPAVQPMTAANDPAAPPGGQAPAAWRPDMAPVGGGGVSDGETSEPDDPAAAGPEKSGFKQRCLDVFSIFDRRGLTLPPLPRCIRCSTHGRIKQYMTPQQAVCSR